jgi:hypothetical protein
MVEYVSVIYVFLLEMIFGILSYRYWVRRYGVFHALRLDFIKSLESHRDNGSLAQYLDDFIAGRTSISRKRKRFPTRLWTFVSMVVGALLSVIVLRHLPIGLLIRTIIGPPLMLPFLSLVSLTIAEEQDENKISSFEKWAREQLLASKESGTVESWIAQLAA